MKAWHPLLLCTYKRSSYIKTMCDIFSQQLKTSYYISMFIANMYKTSCLLFNG